MCCAPLWRNLSAAWLRLVVASQSMGKTSHSDNLKSASCSIRCENIGGKTRSEATTLKIYQQLLHSETNELLCQQHLNGNFYGLLMAKLARLVSFLTKSLSLLLPLFRQLPVTSWLGFFLTTLWLCRCQVNWVEFPNDTYTMRAGILPVPLCVSRVPFCFGTIK